MTAFQNTPLREGMRDKYSRTPFYLLPFTAEIFLLRVLTFPPFQLCYSAFPSCPGEDGCCLTPVRHGDLSLSERAAWKLPSQWWWQWPQWFGCKTGSGVIHCWTVLAGMRGRWPWQWWCWWVQLSQLVYLSGHLNIYQRPIEKWL